MFAKSTKTLIGVAAIAIVLLATPSPANAGAADLSTARAATAGFHQVEAAKAAGYGEFRDAANIACIETPGVGVMGIHYVNGALVSDGVVDAATPEALVYQPIGNGKLRLVAVEYIVFYSMWAGSSKPSLFGQDFKLVWTPNRYGIPAFYELHAWVWQNNPSGMFKDWNPSGSCTN
ncbi:MAG: hypothetical protein E6I66_00435 [Chloroflexi bacterium]|nr:MAG: hypothetical protein E6I66_00435 [Chloroflexota bacterium]